MNGRRLQKSGMAAKKHRQDNLAFRYQTPQNSAVVEYFTLCLAANAVAGQPKIITPGQKIEAVRLYGYHDAFAGLYRACRKYRRTH
jgi:hypothetical protein